MVSVTEERSGKTPVIDAAVGNESTLVVILIYILP